MQLDNGQRIEVKHGRYRALRKALPLCPGCLRACSGMRAGPSCLISGALCLSLCRRWVLGGGLVARASNAAGEDLREGSVWSP